MKISMKTIAKGVIAAGTAVGAAILSIQAGKAAKTEYDSTLEPLGEATTPAEAKPEMESVETTPAPAEEADIVESSVPADEPAEEA